MSLLLLSPLRADPSAPDDAVTFPTPDALVGTLIRFAWLASMVLAIGAVVFRELVLPRVLAPTWPEGPRRLAARAATLGWSAALLALAALAGRLVLQVQELRIPDVPVDVELLQMLVWRTTWGKLWLVQIALAVAAWRAFAGARAGYRVGWTVAAACAAGLAVTSALGSHAAGVEGWARVAVASDAVHALAAGGWAGGLATLFMAALWHRSGTPDDPAALIPRIVHAFSPVALTAAGLLAATGVINSWLQLGSLSDLWLTTWGITLLVKLGFVGSAAAFGAWNWRRIAPRLGDPDAADLLRRSAWWELTAMTLALLATAVLVATSVPSAQ